MINADFSAYFQVWAESMMAQSNKEVAVPVNPNVGTMTSRVMDFTRMNHMKFHGSKVREDPKISFMRSSRC